MPMAPNFELTVRVFKKQLSPHAAVNELAYRIALIFNPSAERTAILEDVVNEGNKPVLLRGVSDRVRLAEWLAARIGEIERLTGTMPSMAVLAWKKASSLLHENSTRALRIGASAPSLAFVGRASDRTRTSESSTCSTSMALEFEAVFFIDGLADRFSDLFDNAEPLRCQPAISCD